MKKKKYLLSIKHSSLASQNFMIEQKEMFPPPYLEEMKFKKASSVWSVASYKIFDALF